MPRKLLILIADGMGDYPAQELDGRTPLQAARTPNMDAAAAQGTVGTCRTIPSGMPAGSDIANMAIMGYAPKRYHTGRGPIEAAAQGLDCAPSDLIYRLNLCTVSELSPSGLMLDHSGGHIQNEEALNLLQVLRTELDTDQVQIIPGFQYRHLLKHTDGVGTLEAGLDLVPPHDILNTPLAPALEVYARSPLLDSMIHRAHSILTSAWNQTQANAIWPWGQGPPLALPSFAHTFGLRGAVISAVDLIKGLGRAAGMDVLDVPGATGLVDTNYQGKVQAALNFLEHGDFVFVHLEGPDECGHAGDLDCKIQAIERFDEHIVGPVMLDLARMEGAVCMACDHLTPVGVRTHTTEPVPFCFLDSRQIQSGAHEGFSEAAAAAGDVHLEAGHLLLPYLLDRMQEADG
ncbi:cofactor-independent phosphoglycerate mutase [Desulfovermiculus halophilus]|jgi:2,3-bisphosphoglycerate-independent phosphoglycerate mutase|uniref:cofactor-independent phosphoglycerate mutase n=1 Tax=Desulfovermiculus halophilus TaxID=339722 RepID=UPI0004891A81|nr:cofactor-independent phosphoglycerate mutase [Desulfovermiculus halophilus]